MTDLFADAEAPCIIIAWGFLGVAAGAALVGSTGRLIATTGSAEQPVLRATGPALTGLIFLVLATRFAGTFELLLFSYLAAVGVVLATTDIVVQRLPRSVVMPSYLVLGALLTIRAGVTGDWPGMIRACAAAATLAGFYLALALATRGGLGAGDIRLAGVLGLTLGWLGWPAVLWATLLAWSLASAGWIILALARSSRPKSIPMGPFLLVGALGSALLAQPG